MSIYRYIDDTLLFDELFNQTFIIIIILQTFCFSVHCIYEIKQGYTLQVLLLFYNQ